MKPVCVITGGGSGMGRATAKLVCEAGYHVILVGRTAAKLESAVAELTEAGHEAEAFACDLSDRASCEKLARHAVERGQVKALLHIAGMSPHMGSPEAILRANALGTVNINDAFYPVMAPGGCVIDTSSMSAYLAPGFIMPKHSYPLARTDREKFLKKMMARINLMPKSARTGVAYSISKHFVIWFAKTDTARFGAKGVRCLSVTPGNFDTPMGQLESAEAQTFTAHSAPSSGTAGQKRSPRCMPCCWTNGSVISPARTSSWTAVSLPVGSAAFPADRYIPHSLHSAQNRLSCCHGKAGFVIFSCYCA